MNSSLQINPERNWGPKNRAAAGNFDDNDKRKRNQGKKRKYAEANKAEEGTKDEEAKENDDKAKNEEGQQPML